jgi:hypothetical protein
MTQSLLIKPQQKAILTKPTIFSLNMRNVTDLFPGFTPGDFAIVYGSPAVNSIMSMLCIRAQLPTQLGGLNSNIVLIEGGNTFRPSKVSRIAQLHHLNPKKALNRICFSQAFTAYQLTTLIMERLKSIVEKNDAKLVIISDIAGLFLDNDIPEEEARRVYSQLVAYLQNFARQHQIILLATYLSRQSSSRNTYLREVSFEKANVVVAFRQTPYDREFTLEKHPRFMLGSAEFLSEDLTLTDFM